MSADAMKLAKLGLLLLLMAGASINAHADWLYTIFGLGNPSWEEEVLLHDGGKIIVEREVSYGGRHEIGQKPPIKEMSISFKLPNSSKTIEWKSEYSADVGRANFNLLALHILDATPYLVTTPNLCLSYNKWGRPNPPYVFFKHDGKEWQRIQLSEFPAEFKTLNMAISLGHQHVDRMVREGLVSAETIKDQNSTLTQPEYRSILREGYAGAGGSCGPMVQYKFKDGRHCGWGSPGEFNRKYFEDTCK